MKTKNNKNLLELIQDNYEINSPADLSAAIKDLFKDSLQEMMNAEFDSSMGYEKHDKKSEKTNYRNGSTKKTLKSEFGEFEFETPRDRNNEFEPKIVPKNKRDVSGIEEKIISLYGRGLSTRDINEQIHDLYGIEVSATMVSNITDQILPMIKDWQERPLEAVYPIVFIDAVHFSVRDESTVVKKAAYIVLGVNEEGEKEIMGIWIGENESAKFWLNVLNEIKRRGVKDILIMCSDGLTGMKEAITTAFPKTVQQRCIVHMIRNSVRFIYYKDLKEFCKDLKSIYTSKNEKAGYEQLQKVKTKWKDKYPSALKNWEDNWDAVCPFFAYSDPVRRIMYTTNAIESLNRSYRKYTKTKSVFPSDQALMKCMYLATMNITKKWTTRYRNWDQVLGELSIIFEGRI
ncbi:putative transposase [Breznakia sp. PF5-3]|uniref:IS256 family transposase n=1 Tax=unclassified Breznakia TaxID=2623764 RepID=UPI002405C3CF|nr:MULTISPECIES: IS256 family transposase [unclassified Breznakia]MDF9825915.1 putative transposase [Breznakia sp. PM6-1]MDF9836710.1 putative transposase [Breznakia sp. PF5-3]MDF9839001.1 putative transposase [Breznakia sp. PFB2-8]MDF9861014.1 putative transposase [Breznakia sp. PH5-24]